MEFVYLFISYFGGVFYVLGIYLGVGYIVVIKSIKIFVFVDIIV